MIPLLLPALVALLPVPGPTPTALPGPLQRILQVLEPDTPEAREQVSRALGGTESLLAYLPLERLARSTLESGCLTLSFDFGREETAKALMRGRSLLVHDLRSDRLVRVEEKTRKLIVRHRVRLLLGPDGVAGIHRGDLRVDGPAWFNPCLELRTTHAPGEVAMDCEGRPIVRTDEEGVAVWRDGRPSYRTADDWAVVTVRGKCLRLPLERH